MAPFSGPGPRKTGTVDSAEPRPESSMDRVMQPWLHLLHGRRRVGDAQLPPSARALRPAHHPVAAAAQAGRRPAVRRARGPPRRRAHPRAAGVAGRRRPRRRRGGRCLARPADHRGPGARAGRRDGRPRGPPSTATWPLPAARRPTASRASGPGRCAACARSGGPSAGATSSRRRSATTPGRRCASWTAPTSREPVAREPVR